LLLWRSAVVAHAVNNTSSRRRGIWRLEGPATTRGMSELATGTGSPRGPGLICVLRVLMSHQPVTAVSGCQLMFARRVSAYGGGLRAAAHDLHDQQDQRCRISARSVRLRARFRSRYTSRVIHATIYLATDYYAQLCTYWLVSRRSAGWWWARPRMCLAFCCQRTATAANNDTAASFPAGGSCPREAACMLGYGRSRVAKGQR
jgi:hypothetical protein